MVRLILDSSNGTKENCVAKLVMASEEDNVTAIDNLAIVRNL